MSCSAQHYHFFFFNDTATTEIYTLSLHDALPIFGSRPNLSPLPLVYSAEKIERPGLARDWRNGVYGDRKSTRLNSSHDQISYAVFCLKKKNNRALCHAPRRAQTTNTHPIKLPSHT